MVMKFNFESGPLNTAVFLYDRVLPIGDIYKYCEGF